MADIHLGEAHVGIKPGFGQGPMVIVPTEYVIVLRRLKHGRTLRDVVAVMRRWYDRWISRRPDLACSAHLDADWEYDPSTRANTAYIRWAFADLPAGMGHHVFTKETFKFARD